MAFKLVCYELDSCARFFKQLRLTLAATHIATRGQESVRSRGAAQPNAWQGLDGHSGLRFVRRSGGRYVRAVDTILTRRRVVSTAGSWIVRKEHVRPFVRRGAETRRYAPLLHRGGAFSAEEAADLQRSDLSDNVM